jgi:hypothetical protein
VRVSRDGGSVLSRQATARRAPLPPERAGVLIVSASLSAARPLAALSMVDEALDRALMTTGLFEEFDVTGKVLRVAPSQR